MIGHSGVHMEKMENQEKRFIFPYITELDFSPFGKIGVNFTIDTILKKNPYSASTSS